MATKKKKYFGLFGNKEITTEEYTTIRRDIDKSVGEMDALQGQMKNRKDEMKGKGKDAIKKQDKSAFAIYSTHYQGYANKEKQLSQGKTTLDLIKVKIEDAYLAQKVENLLGRVKKITTNIAEASPVYEQLGTLQESLRENMNADVYASNNNQAYLQEWQKELESEWSAEMDAEAKSAQGLEEKIKKKKTDGV